MQDAKLPNAAAAEVLALAALTAIDPVDEHSPIVSDAEEVCEWLVCQCIAPSWGSGHGINIFRVNS